MVRHLLIRKGELEQGRLAVRTSEERDAGRQIVGGEPRRHRHRSGIDQEGVPGWHPFVARVGRVDPIPYEGRLMFDGSYSIGDKIPLS